MSEFRDGEIGCFGFFFCGSSGHVLNVCSGVLHFFLLWVRFGLDLGLGFWSLISYEDGKWRSILVECKQDLRPTLSSLTSASNSAIRFASSVASADAVVVVVVVGLSEPLELAPSDDSPAAVLDAEYGLVYRDNAGWIDRATEEEGRATARGMDLNWVAMALANMSGGVLGEDLSIDWDRFKCKGDKVDTLFDALVCMYVCL